MTLTLVIISRYPTVPTDEIQKGFCRKLTRHPLPLNYWIIGFRDKMPVSFVDIKPNVVPDNDQNSMKVKPEKKSKKRQYISYEN